MGGGEVLRVHRLKQRLCQDHKIDTLTTRRAPQHCTKHTFLKISYFQRQRFNRSIMWMRCGVAHSAAD